ncbi:VOC family protein [Planctomyces sp. SH-PL14]|uniref:VOC family protein n=1 Tax=Planctomyces sp. SH-PL14 TaxID=1632864 RepID=UPI00078C9193|nr:VOC family protein [Planctomyces sp. SH-PL14]AMV21387.1 Glyoxalase-like domain protein [Planctomyces sp. SH-PL14]
MSNFNTEKNRIVWADIPVADLDRAARFYGAVLKNQVTKQEFNGYQFCVLDHHDGNGGCLILHPDQISSSGGILVYFNVDGRIRDAVAQAETHGGMVTEAVHSMGPHGHRALVLDSEGNRIALHSNTDA